MRTTFTKEQGVAVRDFLLQMDAPKMMDFVKKVGKKHFGHEVGCDESWEWNMPGSPVGGVPILSLRCRTCDQTLADIDR